MKIVFTGGGTGGHVYPLIAIAERLNHLFEQEKIVQAKLYFFSDAPYDKSALFETAMEYIYVPAAKLRVPFAIQNIFTPFTMGLGIAVALLKLFAVYPDVVIGKGGYAAFPTIVAAKILRIPIIIHESDTVPGRANKKAGKLADKIALSYPEAGKFFPQAKIAVTGQPMREGIMTPAKEGVYDFFKLDPTVPTVLVLGGSSGAEIINNALLDALPMLLDKYQVIHQTGMNNFESVKGQSEIVMAENKQLLGERYRPVGFLNVLGTRMASGAASIVISRAGSALFEIASWHVPSIIIPITVSNGDHQRTNAYSYARSGAAIVIEESNLSPAILASEIRNILDNPTKSANMIEGTKEFLGPNDAAMIIAQEALKVALEHENN